MTTFELFGKTFTVTDEMEVYNTIKNQFSQCADKIRAAYKTVFNGYPSIEKMLDDFDNVYIGFMQIAIKEAITLLIQNEIYDINENKFFELHQKNDYLLTARESYVTILDKYLDIVESLQGGEAYREMRKHNRGKWVGGGFGIEGAIKGAATAGAFNLATGVLHGIGNALANSWAKSAAEKDKNKLFNNPATYTRLSNGIYNDCFCVYITLVELLRKNEKGVGWVSKADSEKARALFSSVKNPAFPVEKVLGTMITVLELDPYDIKYYKFLLDDLHDSKKEVEAIAEYFYLDVRGYKKTLVQDFYSSFTIIDKTTFEEILTISEKIVGFSESVCADTPEDVYMKIMGLLKDRRHTLIPKLFESLPKKTLDNLYSCKENVNQLITETTEKINTAYSNLRGKQGEVYKGGNKDVENISNEIDTLIFDFKSKIIDDLIKSLPLDTFENLNTCREKVMKKCNELSLNEKETDSFTGKVDKKIYQLKSKIINDLIDSFSLDISANVDICKKQVESKCKEFSLDEKEIKKFTGIIDKIIKEQTFNDKVYASIKARDEAEQEYAEMDDILISVRNLENLHQAKEYIIKKSYANSDIAKVFLKRIDDEIQLCENSPNAYVYSYYNEIHKIAEPLIEKNNTTNMNKNTLIWLDSQSVPPKKLNNALATFSSGMNKIETILFFCDSTILNSGKEGLVLTDYKIYAKYDVKKLSGVFNYADIEKVVADGKEIVFHNRDNTKWRYQILYSGDYAKIAVKVAVGIINFTIKALQIKEQVFDKFKIKIEVPNVQESVAKSDISTAPSNTVTVFEPAAEKIEGSLDKAKEILSKANNIISNYFYGQEIPPKKLANAKNSYLFLSQSETILILNDSTVLGSAKDGFCLTDKMLYYKAAFARPEKIDIQDISSFHTTALYTNCILKSTGQLCSIGNSSAGGRIIPILENVVVALTGELLDNMKQNLVFVNKREESILTDESQENIYSVELSDVNANKMGAIKALTDLFKFSLKDAKEMTENLPKIIARDVTVDEANRIKNALVSIGAKVTIK